MQFKGCLKLPMQGPQGIFNPFGGLCNLANYHFCCFCRILGCYLSD